MENKQDSFELELEHEEWIDLREREPYFVELIEESLNEIKEPPNLQQRLLSLLNKNKKTNNS